MVLPGNSTEHIMNLHQELIPTYTNFSNFSKKKLQNKEHYQSHHSVTKIRQRHYQEGKSQANIFDDDRYKNFQQKY